MPSRQASRPQDASDEVNGGPTIWGPPPIPRPRRDRMANQERDRDGSSNRTSRRQQSRNWPSNAARRAERINSMDEREILVARGVYEMSRNEEVESAVGRIIEEAMTGIGFDNALGPDDHHRSTDSRHTNFEDDNESLDILDEVNSHLRALLDRTGNPPNLAATLAAPRMPRQQNFSNQGRANSKRRKIDANKVTPSYKSFRYGQYGQVLPGQLVMEMVSCDGGMFSNESLYAAENILKNDSSVYCTKGNRCNIVLRHQGGIPFTLKEIVIRGPTHMNYSHPVREGMVFVSMDHDDVLNRTAQYQIQYAPPATSTPPSHPATSAAPLPSLSRSTSYTDVPWIPPTMRSRRLADLSPEENIQAWDSSQLDNMPRIGQPRRIVSIRHHEDGTTSTRVSRHVSQQDNEYRRAQMPPEFAVPVPHFGVTTECSDDEEEDAESTHRYLRRPPNRIGNLPFETTGDDDFEDPEIDFMAGRPHELSSEPHAGNMSLAEAWEASNNATQEAVRAVGGELLAPHARFSIEEKKCSCTIRFDPPVTGRFILLKMWNFHSAKDSNIDIQSVIARGFAGPRYFPSVQMR